MNNSVIMTGFHFPPCAVSSGHLRLLAFAKHLPEFGWDPVVLSATKCAYEHVDPGSIESIPEGCRVHRAMALDARRHLGICGRYPSILAQPDRWASWWPSAVLLGLRLIKRYRARAIWSTYPIMTSHCVAYTLSRLTGIPWIADFRDPVASPVASQRRWEGRVLNSAARTVFTTKGALDDYAARYPVTYREGRLAVIANGYEEADFSDLQADSPPLAGRPLVLLHSGLLYPEGRDPAPFFKALVRLKTSGKIDATSLRVVLRASGPNAIEAVYAREIQRLCVDDIVTLAPRISNREALIEQAKADALLLFQGSKFDRQIPAKLYEYLRIGRPIFALVGEHGDTASLLRKVGGAELVSLDDIDAIEGRLLAFLESLRVGPILRARPDIVAKYSRREATTSLAKMFDDLTR